MLLLYQMVFQAIQIGKNNIQTKIGYMLNTQIQKVLLRNLNNGYHKNPITVQYELATESVKTVDSSIVDQDDNTTDNLHTFDTTTHINTYAQGGGLIPFVNIPETISYDVLLKANTQYTIKLNRTNIYIWYTIQLIY